MILKQLEEKEPLADKKADQMAWIRAANQHVVETTHSKPKYHIKCISLHFFIS